MTDKWMLVALFCRLSLPILHRSSSLNADLFAPQYDKFHVFEATNLVIIGTHLGINTYVFSLGVAC